MEKHTEYLNQAIKELKIADHIVNVTFHLVKDKKLLIKALNSICTSANNLIDAGLSYEIFWKRLQAYQEPERQKINLFINKCAKRYSITNEEIIKLKEITELANIHKESEIEFMRKGKLVMLSKDMNPQQINPDYLKPLINAINNILRKIGPILSQYP